MKPAARMGDRIEKGGGISSGSGNVFIGDSGTLITVGNNINVVFGSGCNIYLNCGSPASDSFKTSLANALDMLEAAKQAMSGLSGNPNNTTSDDAVSTKTLFQTMKCSMGVNIAPPPEKEKEQEYKYYVVTAEGLNTELAVFSSTQLLFDISGVDVTDYFEEGRWMMSEPDLGEKANEKIKKGKEQYNRQQLRDKNRAAWKGKYKSVQLISTEIPLSRELTSAAKLKAGKVGAGLGILSWAQKGGVRNELVDKIKL